MPTIAFLEARKNVADSDSSPTDDDMPLLIGGQSYIMALDEENKNELLRSAILRSNNLDKSLALCILLLDYGADANCKDEFGRSPLHYCAAEKMNYRANGDGRLIELLVARGANIDSSDRIGCTPLSSAISTGNFKIARKLLELGANPNLRKFTHSTNLSDAIYSESEEIVRLLLDSGADENDYKAAYIAVTVDQAKFLQLLFEYSAEFSCEGDRKCDTNTSKSICRLIAAADSSSTLGILMENWVDIEIYNGCHVKPCILSRIYAKYRNSNSHANKYERMLYEVIKHVAVLIEENETQIVESTSRLISHCDFMRNKFEEFSRQIKQMKKVLVNQNLDITYFDLLTRKRKSLMACCDKETITAVSRKKLKEFPDFEEKLMRNIKIGVSQRTAIDFKQWLYGVLKSKLPIEIICYICDFLKMREMREIQCRNVDSEIGN